MLDRLAADVASEYGVDVAYVLADICDFARRADITDIRDALAMLIAEKAQR